MLLALYHDATKKKWLNLGLTNVDETFVASFENVTKMLSGGHIALHLLAMDTLKWPFINSVGPLHILWHIYYI